MGRKDPSVAGQQHKGTELLGMGWDRWGPGLVRTCIFENEQWEAQRSASGPYQLWRISSSSVETRTQDKIPSEGWVGVKVTAAGRERMVRLRSEQL